ncbi:BAHD acyltransferase DCR [Malania oleifera]|uniref:BAHD acyltransferase DCR n=1 Tax=Malania oleifera TaxID=397392 RepID=UPI0025AEC4AC|nr:BAHD acyltransferase DCR [Malania oleifera]
MAAEAGKKEEQLSKVKVTSKTHVKPCRRVGRRECQLITFDLPYLAFYYNQKLLFYKGGDFEGTVGKLKEGLGVVLEEYYQLAGRLGKYDDGVFKVEYDDEMDGVEVAEAAADGVAVADLTDENCALDLMEMVPYNGVLNLEGLRRPLLAVQFTKLRDGLVIGCAFNHAILDGTATWHFMSSWAEICRGSKTVSAPPFLERTKVRSTRVKLDLPVGPADNVASSNGDAKPSPQSIREKIFRFSGSAIDAIKSKLNANLPAGARPFSTFQSLSSHVWRAVTRARQLRPEDPTVFTMFVDCRRRVDPPMPESYFGNLIQAVFTGTAAGLLAAQPAEAAAGMIQKAIEAHDAAAIEGRNAEWEEKPVIFEYKDAGVNCVAVGSSPRFRVYEVDFGWGSPERVRSGSNNKFDGMAYLYQGKSGGRSIDLEITLDGAAMERLENDVEFLMVEAN